MINPQQDTWKRRAEEMALKQSGVLQSRNFHWDKSYNAAENLLAASTFFDGISSNDHECTGAFIAAASCHFGYQLGYSAGHSKASTECEKKIGDINSKHQAEIEAKDEQIESRDKQIEDLESDLKNEGLRHNKTKNKLRAKYSRVIALEQILDENGIPIPDDKVVKKICRRIRLGRTCILLIFIALAVLIFCLASCSSGDSGPLRYDNTGRLSSDPEDIERAKQYLREGGKILRDPEAAAIQVSSICRASIGCTISMDGWENAAWNYCQRQYDHLPDTDRWAWHCVRELVDYRDSL